MNLTVKKIEFSQLPCNQELSDVAYEVLENYFLDGKSIEWLEMVSFRIKLSSLTSRLDIEKICKKFSNKHNKALKTDYVVDPI